MEDEEEEGREDEEAERVEEREEEEEALRVLREEEEVGREVRELHQVALRKEKACAVGGAWVARRRPRRRSAAQAARGGPTRAVMAGGRPRAPKQGRDSASKDEGRKTRWTRTRSTGEARIEARLPKM